MTDWPDFTLYKHEKWKFDSSGPELEHAEFINHYDRVAAIQAYLKEKLGNDAPGRVFHAKSHGCLLGEVRLLPERLAETRHGIFGSSAPEKYPVLARFSNGKGTVEPDRLPDVRGVALKIFGVEPGTERTSTF